MAAGEAPTDAGTYKATYSSTPNDGTWSFTGTTYTGGDGTDHNEFTIAKADVTCAATMGSSFKYGVDTVQLPSGYDQFRDGGYGAAPEADKGKHRFLPPPSRFAPVSRAISLTRYCCSCTDSSILRYSTGSCSKV